MLMQSLQENLKAQEALGEEPNPLDWEYFMQLDKY